MMSLAFFVANWGGACWAGAHPSRVRANTLPRAAPAVAMAAKGAPALANHLLKAELTPLPEGNLTDDFPYDTLVSLTQQLDESSEGGPRPEETLTSIMDGSRWQGPLFTPLAAHLSPEQATDGLRGYEGLRRLRLSKASLTRMTPQRQAYHGFIRALLGAGMRQPNALLPAADLPISLDEWALYRRPDASYDSETPRLLQRARAERFLDRFASIGLHVPAPVRGWVLRSLTEASVGWIDYYLDWNPKRTGTTPLEILQEYTRELNAARYFAELRWRARRLMRTLFPGIDLSLSLYARFEPFSLDGQRNASHWKSDDEIHAIQFWQMPGSHGMERDDVLSLLSDSETPEDAARVQARVEHLLIFIHEHAHGAFSELVGEPPKIGRSIDDPSAYGTMTEGFATFVELFLENRMVAEREALGLSDKDVADIRKLNALRLSSLQRDANRYTIGTFFFWQRLYETEGYEGVMDFLKRLKADRLEALSESDPGLRLVRRSPALFKPFLEGDEDVKREVAAAVSLFAGDDLPAGHLARVIDAMDVYVLRAELRSSLERLPKAERADRVSRLSGADPRLARELKALMAQEPWRF